MQRAALAVLAIVVSCWELKHSLRKWLPARGALNSGYELLQILVIAIPADIAFGSIVSLGYRFLGWILD